MLGAELAIYRGWLLEMECGGSNCPVGRSHRVDALAKHYGGETVGKILFRLKCVRCGTGPTSVVLVDPKRDRRVPLRGTEVTY